MSKSILLPIVLSSFLSVSCASSGAAKDQRQPSATADACILQHTATELHGKAQYFNGQLITIAVGTIEDRTGKLSQDEGNKITQGAADMVATSLGKLQAAGVLKTLERNDIRVFERELALIDKELIKTKGFYTPNVNVTAADFYVTGAITELNFNAYSKGTKIKASKIGFSNRLVAATVAIDLRLVRTSTLEIVKTSSARTTVLLDEREVTNTNEFVFIVGQSAQSELQRTVRSLSTVSVGELLTGKSFVQTCTR